LKTWKVAGKAITNLPTTLAATGKVATVEIMVAESKPNPTRGPAA
jgi:hypothetical protein